MNKTYIAIDLKSFYAVEDPSSPLSSEGEIKQFDAASQKMKAVLYGQPGERLYISSRSKAARSSSSRPSQSQ